MIEQGGSECEWEKNEISLAASQLDEILRDVVHGEFPGVFRQKV